LVSLVAGELLGTLLDNSLVIKRFSCHVDN
jgi:hypothetical protein